MVQVMTDARNQHRQYIQVGEEVLRDQGVPPALVAILVVLGSLQSIFIIDESILEALTLYHQYHVEASVAHVEGVRHIVERDSSVFPADFQ